MVHTILNHWITKLADPIKGATEGPLLGVRVAVKDNIDVEGVETTAACPAFAYKAEKSATVVQRLLAAGAQIEGKTNLDQFACGLNGTRSPYGYPSNAFNPAYISGGSSAGSAVAVALDEADIALGTDTAGSGRVPAALNNLIGLKPSIGLLSNHGVVPACASLDCVSIFARDIPTAVKALLVMAGLDSHDSRSKPIALDTRPFPANFHYAVPSHAEFFGDFASEAAWHQARLALKSLGGTEVPIDFAPFVAAAALLYEDAFVAERYDGIKTFYDQHPSELIEPVRSIIARATQFSAQELLAAQRKLSVLATQCAALLEGSEVLITPTTPTTFTIEAMLADPIEANRKLGYYTNFVNLLNYAALAIPTGMRSDGLPFGVTLVAASGEDLRLADLGLRIHNACRECTGAFGKAQPAYRPIGQWLVDFKAEGLEVHASHPRSKLGSTDAASATNSHLTLAVVGAHLTGMPLNKQLSERGAVFLERTTTSKSYALFALPDTVPPKPGLAKVAQDGQAIDLELWSMPIEQVGSFLSLIPSPLGIGTLELADGRLVKGFICETVGLNGAKNISAYGGWRQYIASLA